MILSNKTLDTISILADTLSDIAKNSEAFQVNLKKLKDAKKQADSSLKKLAEKQKVLDASIEELGTGLTTLNKDREVLNNDLKGFSRANMKLDADMASLKTEQKASSELSKETISKAEVLAEEKNIFDKKRRSMQKKLDSRETEIASKEVHINEVMSVMNRGNT